MEETPTFSFVINTYARDISFVRKAVNSIVSSNLVKQIILVDQNSTKLNLQIDSPLLKYVQIDRKNISVARNHSMNFVEKGWIVFLDDDSILDQEYTKNLAEIIDQNPDICVIAGSIIRTDNYKFYSSRQQLGGDINSFKNTKLLMGANFACRADVFRSLGGFDENFGGVNASFSSGEDTDFAWKAYFGGVKMTYCKSLKVYHPPPHSGSFFNNLSRACGYGYSKGALVSKWLFKMKKPVVLYELLEMGFVSISKIVLNLYRPHYSFLHLCVLCSRYWGVFAFLFISRISKKPTL